MDHERAQKRLRLRGGLPAEFAGFLDLGGHRLDPRHQPPLLGQRREGDLHASDILLLQ